MRTPFRLLSSKSKLEMIFGISDYDGTEQGKEHYAEDVTKARIGLAAAVALIGSAVYGRKLLSTVGLSGLGETEDWHFNEAEKTLDWARKTNRKDIGMEYLVAMREHIRSIGEDAMRTDRGRKLSFDYGTVWKRFV